MNTPLFRAVLAAATLLSLGATDSQAALLVRQNFDSNNAGSDLSGQGSSGIGMSGTWAANSLPSAFQVVSGSLAFSDHNTAFGNRLSFSGTAGATRAAQLSLGVGFSLSGTLWSSYLIRMSSFSNATGSLTEVRISSNSNSTGSSVDTRFRAQADSSTASALPAIAMDNGPTAGGTQLNTTDTFMVIGRYLNVSSTPTNSTGTVWVLSESQYASFRDAGFSEAYLDDAANNPIGTGSGDVWARVTDTSTPGGGFGTGNFLQIGGLGGTGSPEAYAIDEVRYASDLLSVVPEPGAVSLLFGGVVFLALRRRRLVIC